MRHFDGVDAGLIQCPGDGGDMFDGIFVAHGMHAVSLRLINTYGPDYKLIFVGDASMSPYELVQAGGAVEHWNAEAGLVWLERLLRCWRRSVWLNPVPKNDWRYTESIDLVREAMEQRMHPLTLAGLDDAVGELSH